MKSSLLGVATLLLMACASFAAQPGEADRMKNLATYNQPDLPIMPEVVREIVDLVEEDN